MEKRRRIGAYGVVFDENKRLLLVRSSPRSNTPGMWYLPGGGLDHGEDPIDGVHREFREETGLQIEIAGIRQVSADMVEFPWRDVLLHHDRIVFDVRITGGELIAESDGSSDLPLWVPFDEVAALKLVPFARHTLGLSDEIKREINEKKGQNDDSGEVAANGLALDDPRRSRRFAAYGIVTDPDQRVLLSLISPGYPGAGMWHLPGGGTDFGETPQEGLVREIYEETSQIATVGRPIAVGSSHHPEALGPEGYPIDWYNVRAIFEVSVLEPNEPRVIESAGSTVAAKWFDRTQLAAVDLTELARKHLL